MNARSIVGCVALLLPLLGGCTLPLRQPDYRVGNNPTLLGAEEAQRELILQTLELQIEPPLDAPIQMVNVELPEYPKRAQRRQIEGPVVVKFLVLADGSVSDITELESPHLDLYTAVREALSRWKFTPMLRNGASVSQKFVFRYQFELE